MKSLFNCITPVVFLKNRSLKERFSLLTVLMFLSIFCITATTLASAEYDASDVDSPPKIVRQMPVKYPAQAKKDGVTGRVVVRCLIGTKGKAEKMEIVESEPAGIFDDSAISTLKYWQFRPGILKGELVATWVKVPFKFE